MTSKILEGFSISHAAILDGTTGAEEALGDIYGVRSGTLAADTGNYDNTGDDSVLSSWYWLNFATLTVQAGFMSMDLYGLLSGNTVTTTGVSPADTHSMPLWDVDSVNQPARPVLLQLPAKDKNQVKRTINFVLYRVQFAPISFDGPSYKSGLLVNYTGRCVVSDVDETGIALAKKAVGRILSKP